MNKRFILVPLLSVMLAAGGCALLEPHEEEPEPEIRADALTMDEDRRLRLEDLERARVEAERARERERMVMDALEDPDSPLSDRTVYFEFDSSELSEAGEELLKAHAEFLSNNSGLRIVVEGHTDERGSREYNLGLGERRAKAVRRFLSLNGVSSDQIRIVSYGEERPAALGQGEEAWSQNRRAELVYPEM